MSFVFPEHHFLLRKTCTLPALCSAIRTVFYRSSKVLFCRMSPKLRPKTCQGKPEMSVGMLIKLWADWVFLSENEKNDSGGLPVLELCNRCIYF